MKVPVYSSPQVGAAALPAVRESLDVRNGLGAVGEGVQRAGAGLQRAVDVQDEASRQAHAKAVAGAATDAENAYSNEAITILHGTPDGKDRGFFGLQGKDALAQSAPVQQRLDEAQKRYAEKLSPEAKALFAHRTDALKLSYRRSIETYAGNQADAANMAAAKASASTAERIASLQYADDNTVGVASAAAESAIAAQLHGMPGEVVHQAIQDVRQRVAVARVKAAVGAEDLPAAQRLIQAYGAQVGPALVRTVATLGAKKLGEKNAAAAIAVAVNPETGLVDEAALDEAFDATPEAARTPEFVAAFERQKAAALSLDKGHRAGVYREALSQYLNGGNHLAAVHADTLQWLKDNDPEGARRIQAMADKDAAAKKRAASGGGSGPTQEQVGAYVSLRVDMENNREKYAAMPADEFLREWSWRLSTSDLSRAGVKLAEIHGEANKPDKDLRLPAMATQALTGIFQDVYGLNKVSPAKWKPEQKALFYSALNQVEIQERQWKKEHGGNAPPLEQYVKWGNDELGKHPVPGTGLHIPVIDTTIGAKETNRVEARAKGKPIPGEAAPKPVSAAGLNLDASPVPSDARARILAALQRSGRTPTEADVRNLYVAGVAKGIFQ